MHSQPAGTLRDSFSQQSWPFRRRVSNIVRFRCLQVNPATLHAFELKFKFRILSKETAEEKLTSGGIEC